MDGQFPQCLQCPERLLVLALAQQPEGALVQHKGAHEDQGCGRDLHGHGDAPGRSGVGVHGVVDY